MRIKADSVTSTADAGELDWTAEVPVNRPDQGFHLLSMVSHVFLFRVSVVHDYITILDRMYF